MNTDQATNGEKLPRIEKINPKEYELHREGLPILRFTREHLGENKLLGDKTPCWTIELCCDEIDRREGTIRMIAQRIHPIPGVDSAPIENVWEAVIEGIERLKGYHSDGGNRTNELSEELNRIKDGNSGLLDRALNAEKALANARERYGVTVAALGIPKGVDHAGVLREIVTIRAQDAQRREALTQLENLGKFIGHPGATPAHVVSETVSLIEKFLKVADLVGCKMDQAASGVAESMLNWSRRSKGSWNSSESTRLLEEMSGMPFDKGGREWAELWIKDAEMRQQEAPKTFDQDLTALINRHSMESDSGTPDFILAGFLQGVFHQFNMTVRKRATWYGSDAEKRGPREGERLKALRDDTNLPVETRRQAAVAFQTWSWLYDNNWATIAPSECLERGLPMLVDDVKP